MDDIKIDNFRETYSSQAFPTFHVLSLIELESIQLKLREKLRLKSEVDLLGLSQELSNLGEVVTDIDARNDGFNLSEFIESLGLCSNDSIYLNWYRFDDIDEMLLTELSCYFDDIWYASVDDVDIFDDSLSWFVSIRHDGAVYIYNV